MLDQALGRLAADFAVDLGTSNTRVFVRGRGVAVECPSVVALERNDAGREGVTAVGEDARRMLGRTPQHIRVVHPVRSSVIADFDTAEVLLRACWERAGAARGLRKPRVLVSTLHDTGEVERRAVQESARKAGAREVRLVPKIVVAALGAGLSIEEARVRLVVDIGGGTTEVGLVSLGAVVAAATLRIAGNDLDRSLSAWIREHHQVLVGERAAEDIKLAAGAASAGLRADVAHVNGRDLTAGVPREVPVGADDTAMAYAAPIEKIVEGLQRFLSTATPEAAADISEDGLVLCGGSALLPGLPQLLAERTGIPVAMAEDPQRAAILGLGQLLDLPEVLERVAL